MTSPQSRSSRVINRIRQSTLRWHRNQDSLDFYTPLKTGNEWARPWVTSRVMIEPISVVAVQS